MKACETGMKNEELRNAHSIFLLTMRSVPKHHHGNSAGMWEQCLRLGTKDSPIILNNFTDLVQLLQTISKVFAQSVGTKEKVKVITTLKLKEFMLNNSTQPKEFVSEQNTFLGVADIEFLKYVPSYTVENTERFGGKYNVYPVLMVDLEEKHIHDPSYSALAWIRINEN